MTTLTIRLRSGGVEEHTVPDSFQLANHKSGQIRFTTVAGVEWLYNYNSVESLSVSREPEAT